MIRFYHAPIEIDGHKLLVDMPWFMTDEEYLKWYEGLREWVHEQYGNE